MLLQSLKAYSERAQPGFDEDDELPPLYAMTPIAYFVELREDGSLATNRPTPQAVAGDKILRRGLPMAAPEVVRAAGVKPLLLADKGDYTFGIAVAGKSAGREQIAHKAFIELLEACRVATQEQSVEAVCSFYEAGGLSLIDLPDDYDVAGKVTFRIHRDDGTTVMPINMPSVQRFWANYNDPAAAGARVLQCVTCGERKPALARLQAKVKGVRGGQSAGTAIISANAEAFESFGLEASHIAATCADCGEAFTRGLNALIKGATTHLYVGDSTYVFWARNCEWSPFSYLSDPTPDSVQALLESANSGRGTTISTSSDEDADAFYAVALSGSGGRTVVRDWIDTTVGSAKDNLADWFRAQRIVDWNGEPAKYLGAWQLAASLARKLDDLPKPVVPSLIRAALAGTLLGAALLESAVRRASAERRVNHSRAAFIKLVLMSQPGFTLPSEEYMVALEPNHPDAAYHCGRLLAVLEKIQRRALPNVSNTIVDRYFGIASSAPASVFGRLIRGAQPHLSTIENGNTGAYVNLQRELEDVLSNINAFPAVLTLQRQGLFCLGFYHQRAWRSPGASAAVSPATPTTAG